MDELETKITKEFEGFVVRKDLVKTVKGNAIVPTYVLEYLLGQYCATSDEDSIQLGIKTVKEILAQHYVHRNEAGLVRSNIKEKGSYKVIDKISVSLNDKQDVYEASFANLGIKEVLVDSRTIKTHPKLLVSGVWCIAEIEYEFTDDRSASPWILSTLKPIQLSGFDFDLYVERRRKFTTEEWIDLLMQSVGFDPEMFGKRSKLTQLMRLVPFCERNYNLIELGPKGTGKSHIFSEFSPHGILISGGEVTVPKLFVNNASGKIGLVGYWDVVAFDEFAGKDKKANRALVDIMKNYMANKSFSRGVETLGAEASMVFVGNTQHTVPFMLKHSDLFDELPPQYHDSAFLDRIHFYIPGWEVDIIRSEMFSDRHGFVVDYLAEILRSLRNRDFSDRYQKHFTLSSDVSTRDKDGINKTFSGLMKLIYPAGEAAKDEIEELLRFAVEGRKRVKDQLMRFDNTYSEVKFAYKDNAGKSEKVSTLEEVEYPAFYSKEHQVNVEEPVETVINADDKGVIVEKSEPNLEEGHHVFKENQRGISFDKLFGPYIKDATRIELTDPYIRKYHQFRCLMEFLETVIRSKPTDKEIAVHLVTGEDDFDNEAQVSNLENIGESCEASGITFTWKIEDTLTIHARHIVTDTGWKISLDRGLDIFLYFDAKDPFSFANRLQETRRCKPFEITYIRMEEGE